MKILSDACAFGKSFFKTECELSVNLVHAPPVKCKQSKEGDYDE